MAKLLTGRLAGTKVRVIQWANDWVSIEGPGLGARDRIVSPTRLELDATEIRQFRDSMSSGNLGQFWALWSLGDNGRFTAITAEPVLRWPRS